MDTKDFITEPLLSLIFTLSTGQVGSEPLSQSLPSACLKFDEFLVRNICSELINFHHMRNFKIQSFLIRMFLSFNENNLQLPEMAIIEEMCKDYCKCMNILMVLMYEILFQQRLPRVLPEMKFFSHLSHERRVGYWFLCEYSTVIRVYGFTHQPYVLPTFLTLRVFALELIR